MIKFNYSLVSALVITASGVAFASSSYAQTFVPEEQVENVQSNAPLAPIVHLDNSKPENKRALEIKSNLEKAEKIRVQEESKKSLNNEKDSTIIVDNTVNNKFKSFIIKYNPGVQKTLANKIAANVFKYGTAAKVDPELVLALIARESSFRTDAVSPVGAIGLGQLMRPTARELGVSNPFNPVENIRGTTKYLSQLLKQFNGNVDLTLASYNMGPGAVSRSVKRGRALPYEVAKYVSDIKSFKTMI